MPTQTVSAGSPIAPPSASDPEIVAYDEARHYEMLRLWWWARHRVEFLPPECVPPTTYLAYRDDGWALAAVSLYVMRDVPIAQVAFAITSPHVSHRWTAPALDRAIATAVSEAKTQLRGRGFLWAPYHDKAMHRLMTQRHGFTEAGDCFTSVLILDRDIDPGMISGDT